MLNRCLTPGCPHFAAPADVLCTTCRQQSNNAVSVAYYPLLGECAEFTPQPPDLGEDLAKIAAFLVSDQNQQQRVIRRQQDRLDLREKIIRKLTRHRNDALDQATAEHARANGLEDQVDGLQRQVAALQAELDQLVDLSRNGKKPGLATLDTAPGDYSPELAGFNVLWTRVDPVTGREVLWRWYRVD